jgi:ABC-type ATPase with predicted acetyltransferase domain
MANASSLRIVGRKVQRYRVKQREEQREERREAVKSREQYSSYSRATQKNVTVVTG